MHSVIDSSTVLLFVSNIIQMGLIAFLLLPLLDVVTQAKSRLHEFSDLMANYDLVDIGYAQNQDEDLPVIGIIEDEIEGDDVDAFNWPLVVHLSEKETLRLKSFLEESPRACTLIQRDSVILIPERSELAERIDEIEIPLDCDVENFTILKDSGQLSEVIETKKEPPQQNDKLV
ncbi:hypothetical protein HW555_003705 [Spodoptera exigua]|uniref:Uncharacterized protein n=1 Tax=Spodoptera exigua TaxID=7107 RepID=A0A835L621_SPOEX|nr:hypothetical protein HW555_003705 [Spodoptera exigua]